MSASLTYQRLTQRGTNTPDPDEEPDGCITTFIIIGGIIILTSLILAFL